MSKYTPLKDLFDLSDNVAIVTGAPGQLGEAISESLAELGAHIVAVARTESDCEELAERLSTDYQRAIAAPADVTNPDEVTVAVEHAVDEFGSIDILVNNAYSGDTMPLEEMSIEEFREGLDAALTSTFLMTRESLPELRNGGGSIINIASIYGVVAPDHSIYGDSGLNNPFHYGVAKAGVIQQSRWIATRYADEDIRANSISPGGLYDAGLESVPDYKEEFVPNYEERTPLGRMGEPTDLKGAVAFLASEASRWMTGQNVVVDGGWTAW